MAIKLHRAKGFIFNNCLVDNLFDINTESYFPYNGIYSLDVIEGFCLLDVIKNATPIKTRYDFIVPKRNGSITLNNRYEDNYIDVVLGIYEADIVYRRYKQRELLQRIINVKSKLFFLDEPNLFYNAEIIDAIEVVEGEIFTELTIHFKASCYKYGAEKNITLLPGANTINNAGNYNAENIIEVTALSNSDSIVIDNGVNSFTLSNVLAGETIYIDSEKMIVYKIVDGIKQSVLTRFTGQFFQILKGNNIITLSGTNFSATVNIKFNDTYIV